MTDGAGARQLGQRGIVEDLRDQPHPVVALELTFLVGVDHDARTFLPAMLQGVEPEESDFRRMGMAKYGEDSTLILGTV